MLATPCWPVIDCKMNDLEWIFHVIIRFRPARLSRTYFCVKSHHRKLIDIHTDGLIGVAASGWISLPVI